MDLKSINTLRLLSVDMVENAKSGHPGMPLGCSPMMYILFKNFINLHPLDTTWINRDRFILSNGHGCALLYSILHMYKYNISIDDLKKFRQLGSITPGHPEKNITPGIEVTTGPLGQGFANGVGVALAMKHLGSKFNTDNMKIINNKVYVMCGDGCLMEGITNEAASLAGHLRLNNLIVLYDDNMITIDGSTNLGFTENTKDKYIALGWNVLEVMDGNLDLESINNSLEIAQSSEKPVLIMVKTKIGFGSEKEGSEKSHGSPLGEENVKKLKEKFNFPIDKKFYIPDDVIKSFEISLEEKIRSYENWYDLINQYEKKNPEKFKEFNNIINGVMPDLLQLLPKFNVSDKSLATRQVSGMCLQSIYQHIPQLIGGSADLSPSNNTVIDTGIQYTDYSRRYIHYGVREHAMCAIANGMSTCYMIPYVATFLVFINYCLASIRLSALSKHQVLYILTHDSIGLGEDGPTHQPVESLAILRSIPNCLVFRPADGNEVSGCYNYALDNKIGPSCLCLSRQSLPQLEGSNSGLIGNGGYVLYEKKNNIEKLLISGSSDSTSYSINCKHFDVIIIATGSEVSSCYNVIKSLEKDNIYARLVSMPCVELYDRQSEQYKNLMLPKDILKISVEAATTTMWYKYADHCIGIDGFGASGNGKEVMDYFSLSEIKIEYEIRNILKFNNNI